MFKYGNPRKLPMEISRKEHHHPQEVEHTISKITTLNFAHKNLCKQLAGKNLVYNKCDVVTQRGLDASRSKEWEKWETFFAAHFVRGQELKDLLKDGHQLIPIQWIETDKNEHKNAREELLVFSKRTCVCNQAETNECHAHLSRILFACSFCRSRIKPFEIFLMCMKLQ